jgi:hypothetical protein
VSPLDVVTWAATGLAVIATAVSGWLTWSTRRQTRSAAAYAATSGNRAKIAEDRAEQAERAVHAADAHATRAWEQVTLARTQLQEARGERNQQFRADQWEKAHAMTMAARHLVDSTGELINLAANGQTAAEYRVSGNPKYQQAAAKWQEVLVHSVAGLPEDVEVHQLLIAFSNVHLRLHGQLGLLLRDAGNHALNPADLKRIGLLRQELDDSYRRFQRALSRSIVNQYPEDARQIENRDSRSLEPPA